MENFKEIFNRSHDYLSLLCDMLDIFCNSIKPSDTKLDTEAKCGQTILKEFRRELKKQLELVELVEAEHEETNETSLTRSDVESIVNDCLAQTRKEIEDIRECNLQAEKEWKESEKKHNNEICNLKDLIDPFWYYKSERVYTEDELDKLAFKLQGLVRNGAECIGMLHKGYASENKEAYEKRVYSKRAAIRGLSPYDKLAKLHWSFKNGSPRRVEVSKDLKTIYLHYYEKF